jgi:hypothetical protein
MNIDLKVKFEGNSAEGKDLNLYALPIKDDDTGEYLWVHFHSEGMDAVIFEVTREELNNLVAGINIAVDALIASKEVNEE